MEAPGDNADVNGGRRAWGQLWLDGEEDEEDDEEATAEV